jgi:anaerobic ribonucleoside-triphosphate reductase activating protein
MTILMHSRLEQSLVNGPGSRAVIWLQGCSLNCPGCWNPLSHSIDAGISVEVASVVEWVADLQSNRLIDGLTISGGEPMEQASALLALLQALRLRIPKISIGLFSGYTETELARGAFLSRDAHPPSHQANLWRAIRQHLDFAVLGRFNGHRPSNQPLVSSQNQALLLLSDRHSSNDFSPLSVEFNIDSQGITQITGFLILQ